jgi:hypothetical protein
MPGPPRPGLRPTSEPPPCDPARWALGNNGLRQAAKLAAQGEKDALLVEAIRHGVTISFHQIGPQRLPRGRIEISPVGET